MKNELVSSVFADLGMEHHYFLGIVLSSFSFARMISAPFYGYLADKGSVKTILLLSNIWQIGGNALYFVANDPYLVLEGR